MELEPVFSTQVIMNYGATLAELQAAAGTSLHFTEPIEDADEGLVYAHDIHVRDCFDDYPHDFRCVVTNTELEVVPLYVYRTSAFRGRPLQVEHANIAHFLAFIAAIRTDNNDEIVSPFSEYLFAEGTTISCGGPGDEIPVHPCLAPSGEVSYSNYGITEVLHLVLPKYQAPSGFENAVIRSRGVTVDCKSCHEGGIIYARGGAFYESLHGMAMFLSDMKEYGLGHFCKNCRGTGKLRKTEHFL